MIGLQAFEAMMDSRVCRICFVVGHLKYQSTYTCPPSHIFSRFVGSIIQDNLYLIFSIYFRMYNLTPIEDNCHD